jgi:hypothetical protein
LEKGKSKSKGARIGAPWGFKMLLFFLSASNREGVALFVRSLHLLGVERVPRVELVVPLLFFFFEKLLVDS